MAPTLTDLVTAVADTWSSTAELADELKPDDWDRPTGCPGWTVKDNLSHIVGVERQLLGEPVPDHELPAAGLDHVKDKFARHMEVAVDLRRPWAPADVVAEFRDVTARRLEQLRAMGPADLDAQVPGPFGPTPAGSLLGIRVFDCWFHEQDMRRATGHPGGVGGPAAVMCRDRVLAGLARVLPGKIAAAAGTVVALEITGPTAAVVGYRLPGGSDERAERTDDVAGAAAHLRLDLTTLAALAGGRTDRGPVDVTGDHALATAVMAAMAMTP